VEEGLSLGVRLKTRIIKVISLLLNMGGRGFERSGVLLPKGGNYNNQQTS